MNVFLGQTFPPNRSSTHIYLQDNPPIESPCVFFCTSCVPASSHPILSSLSSHVLSIQVNCKTPCGFLTISWIISTLLFGIWWHHFYEDWGSHFSFLILSDLLFWRWREGLTLFPMEREMTRVTEEPWRREADNIFQKGKKETERWSRSRRRRRWRKKKKEEERRKELLFWNENWKGKNEWFWFKSSHLEEGSDEIERR